MRVDHWCVDPRHATGMRRMPDEVVDGRLRECCPACGGIIWQDDEPEDADDDE